MLIGIFAVIVPKALAVNCAPTQTSNGSLLVQTFSSPDGNAYACTWTAPAGVSSINVLVVGAGGGGGTGGGGGGGVAYVSNFAISALASFGVNIGQGGSAGSGDTRGGNGTNSSLVRNSDNATAVIGGGGGGGGSHHGSNPSLTGDIDGANGISVTTSVSGGAAAGGSGGGAAMSYEYSGARIWGRGGQPGTGTTSNGFAGASNFTCSVSGSGAAYTNYRLTGGGAGAGGAGTGTVTPPTGDPANNCNPYVPTGGSGVTNSITGTAIMYASGGGGADGRGNGEGGTFLSFGRGNGGGNNSDANGGNGGAGQSYYNSSANLSNYSSNTVTYAAVKGVNGRGEGGGGAVDGTGVTGGAGIVIISYVNPGINPTIATQPQSQTITQGANGFTLNVLATASVTDSISYQWYQQKTLNDTATALTNGSRITGATGATLTVGNSGSTVVASDAGIYYVIATNTFSGATSTVQSINASIIVSILQEDFRNTSLSNPSDWVFSYINSTYANDTHTIINDAGSIGNSTANTYFQPCLTASASASTTVTTGNTEATDGEGSSKTVGAIGSCNGVSIDSAGGGALRLSSFRLDTRASAVYTRGLSVTNGLDISFNYASYGGYKGSGTSGPADGSSFYIKDGTSTDYSPGGGGGAVGYSQRAGAEPGVTAGLFAIAMDIYGNVGTSGHEGTDCPPSNTAPNTATITDFSHHTYTAYPIESQYANRVKILGPTGLVPTGTPNYTGYCLLSPSGQLATSPLSNISAASTSSTFANLATTTRSSAVSHVIRIMVDPTTVASPKIYALVDGTIRYSVAEPDAYKNLSTFKFGFSSATGGSSSVTEFWGINVNTFNGITPPDPPTAVTISNPSSDGSSNTISWTQPGMWGVGELASGATGAVDRSYKVTLYDASGNATTYGCTTTGTSCTISNIGSGTYTAQVTATNRSGLISLPSNSSAAFSSTLQTVLVPTKIPVDPQMTYLDILNLSLNSISASTERVCVNATNASGVIDASSLLIFDVGTLGAVDTATSSATITGDRTNSLRIDGTPSNVSTVLTSGMRVTKSDSSRFATDSYVRVRQVAVSGGTCADSSLSSDTNLDIFPLIITAQRKNVVPLIHGGSN